jgi:hypothetical protein
VASGVTRVDSSGGRGINFILKVGVAL